MEQILKRNKSVEAFDFQKIYSAVERAFNSGGYSSIPSDFLKDFTSDKFTDCKCVEEIQDKIEHLLHLSIYEKVYRNFVNYRANHALLREIKTKSLFDSIIATEKNDITRDNGNMNSDTPAGMMMKFASETTKTFTDKYMLSGDVKKAVDDNILYIHDKDYYLTRSMTCLQHPLDRILGKGFMAGHGEARPAKRIETASVLAAISMETIQNEMHGGQAIPAFDFYMAPYVRMTYLEEINKIKEIIGDTILLDWESMKEAQFSDYLIKPTDNIKTPYQKYQQIAINNTVKRVYQAMESFIHNMNSIHSRGGNQVVFSSINYGTDTSAEGRCIIRELLKSTYAGVGHDATAIFPIQIWKCKSGVSVEPGDPNFDLFSYSWKVSARRFYPNYLNLDATFNQDDAWDENDPKRYEHEVATMGCRTRVFENIAGPKTSIGRGNISFSTLNFPKMAIQVAIEDGFLNKVNGVYSFNNFSASEEDKIRRVNKFINKLKEYIGIAAKQLNERYQFQKEALAKQFPLLMSGMWNGSDKLQPNDTIESVINQGTLGIGFIGLAEALTALTGQHHGESEFSQSCGLKIISTMYDEIGKLKKQFHHNYAVLGTPAEGLSGRFTIEDKKEFGEIKGVTDKEYYTNSNHIPVNFKCTPTFKAEHECPYHKYTTGGHIFYVEADADITKNPYAIGAIVNLVRQNNGGYLSINHVQGRCKHCNFESNDPNLTIGSTCPQCGTKNWDILQRITGYLVGTTDRWNNGKLHELHDRVTHVQK